MTSKTIQPVTAEAYAKKHGLSPSQTALDDLNAFLKPLQASPVYGKDLSFPEPAFIWGMSLLYKNLGKGVNQSDIAQYYRDHNVGKYNGQVRHEARRGYKMATGCSRTNNMEHRTDFKRSQIALLTVSEASSKVVANRSRKMGKMAWAEKVAWFEEQRGGCGYCGTKYPTYDQGHLIRSRPAIDDNVAPLCSSCNNWLQAKNKDAEVDDCGVVRPIL